MDPLKRALTNVSMERMLRVINLLRQHDRELPAQLMATFLYVCSHNPCHKQALEEDLMFTTASGSRNVNWLSDKHRLKKPGLGLINCDRDPSNRRRLLLKLTPKGLSISKEIESILYD
ncbi:MAG: hypothetical protein CL779_02590 [Chloroflexi bacterium]|nr:hypothetical protein [Chloroflexota bacterium]